LLSNLRSTIEKLQLPATRTEWGDYYDMTNYSQTAFSRKQEIVEQLIRQISPKTVCDIGANNSLFSKLASQQQIWTLAVDIDPMAVEYGYREIKRHHETELLPLVIDLTNPSPGIGWANQERQSFLERTSVDAVSALALIHHLTISNNLPFDLTAQLFAQLAPQLIIEFVPKEDSQVQKLLANRHDHFSNYHKDGFETAYGRHFTIVKQVEIKESSRVIYWLKRK
jgi:ribosomal protein L11 methylase PrmA